MRVYAETNFVLEIVLEQGECGACEDLLALAERGEISLAIPAFGLVEPITTLRRRSGERSRVARELESHVREIGRTLSLAADAASNDLAALLVRSAQRAEDRYRSARERIMAIADVLPLGGDAIADAERLDRELDLTLSDALILASVLASVLGDDRLGREPTWFANRNTKDFDEPRVVALLMQRQCKLLRSFSDVLALVGSISKQE